jgi:hypothetical protein
MDTIEALSISSFISCLRRQQKFDFSFILYTNYISKWTYENFYTQTSVYNYFDKFSVALELNLYNLSVSFCPCYYLAVFNHRSEQTETHKLKRLYSTGFQIRERWENDFTAISVIGHLLTGVWIGKIILRDCNISAWRNSIMITSVVK